MSFDYKGFGSVLNDFGAAAQLFGASSASSASAAGFASEAGAYDLASTTALTSAKLTGAATDIQDTQTRRQIYQTVEGSRADIAGAGLAESGSALDVLRSSRAQGDLQLRLIQTQGEIQQAAFSQQSAAYSAEGNAARANVAAAQAGSKGSAVGGILKTVGTIASIIGIFCWVAREVYGEDDPRWREMREFVLVYGPLWFMHWYMNHGADFAIYIHTRPVRKSLVRVAFDCCRWYMRGMKQVEKFHAEYSRV